MGNLSDTFLIGIWGTCLIVVILTILAFLYFGKSLDKVNAHQSSLGYENEFDIGAYPDTAWKNKLAWEGESNDGSDSEWENDVPDEEVTEDDLNEFLDQLSQVGNPMEKFYGKYAKSRLDRQEKSDAAAEKYKQEADAESKRIRDDYWNL